MSETKKHWSKTINKLENIISANNNTIVNITTGVTEVPRAESATNAAKATSDSNGNNIINTYSTKEETVNISTAQEIGGIKTFTSNPVISNTDNASIILKSTDVVVSESTENEEVCGILIRDKNSFLSGAFRKHFMTDGSTYSDMYVSNGTVNGNVAVNINSDGVVYGSAPSTPVTATSNEIVTVDYLKDHYTVDSATSNVAGIMKLYDSTGSSTDGTMTRNSITTQLNLKAPSTHTSVIANETTLGHVKLSDSTSSEFGVSDGIAATPKAVKTAYDLASAALPKTGGTITGDLTVEGVFEASVSNAATADKLSSAGTITLAGDASGSVAFDGSDATLTVTVADDSHNHTVENIDNLETLLASKSAIASPTFTGSPKAPTAAAGTNTTQIATTAFVTTAVANKTSVSGNAGTATKLATARTIGISGGATGTATSFDGSGNITIPVTALDVSKATAGTLAVARGGTGLTASPSLLINLASTSAANVLAASPRPGVTGVLPVANGGTGSSTKNFVDLSSNQTVGGTKTFSGAITSSLTTGTYLAGNQGTAIINSTSSAGSYTALFRMTSTNGVFTMSQHQTKIQLHYTANSTITAGTNSTTKSATLLDESGNASFPGTLTASAVYNAVWNDYAEFFPRGEETEAGDFVALSLDSDNEVYVKATKETSKSVGIHSDSFGHLIGGEQVPEGQDFVEYNLPKYIPVGLVGRVRANIVGEVKKGNFIVISDIPGVGRAFNKEIDSYVDIIGMACESSSEKDIKRIKVKLGN